MKLKIAFILFSLLLFGCINFNFYSEFQPKYSIIQESYKNTDSSFVIGNYFFCYKNDRYSRVYETDFNTEDSLMNIIKISLQKKNLRVISEKGINLITNEFCSAGKRFNGKNLQNHIDSLLLNTSFFNNDKTHYVILYIFLNDYCEMTNFHSGNVYINHFGAAVMINVVKNRNIIYSKHYTGGGVSDNKTRVTDDWPNCPERPDVFYEQAHWDTLVSLAIEDYMKRLNVDKR